MMKHVFGIRSWLTLGFLALPLALVAGSKGKVGVKSFVPPAPAAPTAVESATIDGPEFDSHVFARELPLVFAAKAPAGARHFEGELRLRKAEEHFRKGKDLAARNELAAARVEFDSAIEEISGASLILPDRARLTARYQTLVDEISSMESKPLEAGATEPTPAAVDSAPLFDRAPVEQIAETTFSIEPELKGKVLEQVKSTASQLRLEVEDPVVGYINFFTTPFGREIVAAGIRRAGRYAPMIRRILDEEGLPPEMIYLAQAESGFMPRAVSWASAAGMWQFVQSRGREYGLTQTPMTDERYDPEKATRAAARHLRDLYHQFGDWYLAVAGYNCGPWAVERGVQRTGYADFWELYRRNVLPRETANYLPIILALTIMAKNPKAYGLDGIMPDPPHEYDTIRLTADTHLELVADLAERTLPQIQELNPSVLKLIAPAGYDIHVPKGSGPATLARLEFVPAAKRTSWRVRRMQSGESVISVAAQYHVTESAVAAANRPVSSGDSAAEWSPEPGDFLVIPAAYPGATPASAAAVRRGAVSRRAATPSRTRAATKTSASVRKPAAKTVTTARR